jgi:small subunit ribosomal protein S9
VAENEDQVNEPEETPATPPEEPAAEAPVEPSADEVVVEGDEITTHEDVEDEEEEFEETPRVKPAIPGLDLDVDIVREGEDVLGRGERPRYSEDEADEETETSDDSEEELPSTIADASIDLAAGARYRATGKRKTAVARVTLKPGTGEYVINGKALDVFFPRATLQRTIRQPLETVGYETRMDVVAAMHGGGVSAQADALRHGISRALLEADPNLRSELKRRGFLTRDARVKERKKAGLKKARKRPQFSKR